jgi:hypothetical protein
MAGAKAIKIPPKTSGGRALELLNEADCEKHFDTTLGLPRDGKIATKIAMPQNNGAKAEIVSRIYDSVGIPSDRNVRVAFEHKIGWVRYSRRVRLQVQRDAELVRQLRANPDLANDVKFVDIEWVFFAKESKSGLVGPDKDLLQALQDAGIKYTIYLTRT